MGPARLGRRFQEVLAAQRPVDDAGRSRRGSGRLQRGFRSPGGVPPGLGRFPKPTPEMPTIQPECLEGAFR